MCEEDSINRISERERGKPSIYIQVALQTPHIDTKQSRRQYSRTSYDLMWGAAPHLIIELGQQAPRQ